MTDRTRSARNNLSDSAVTIPSDSESYSAHHDLSPSPPPSTSSSPLILYSPPTPWGLLRGAAINLLLPFINGLMLGFGELFAHEAAFRLGWGGTKVSENYHTVRIISVVIICRRVLFEANDPLQVFPNHRTARSAGPGVEIRGNISERRRQTETNLDDLTSLE